MDINLIIRSVWPHVKTIDDLSDPLVFKIRTSTDQTKQIVHNEIEKSPRMQLGTWLDHKIGAI